MYKNISILALLVLGLAVTAFVASDRKKTPAADSIKWYTWDEAVNLNKKKPKKIFIDVYTDWCGWCKRMDAQTFTNPEVIGYMNANFYPVKFNAEQKETIKFQDKEFGYQQGERGRGVHMLAYSLLDGRLGYPAFVMLNEKYERIALSPGYKEAPQLMKELKFAKEEIYKNKSWDEYVKGAN